jgi:hypothetical protein
MLAAWILGSAFFVFVICFILYVVATDVSQPESAGDGRAQVTGALLDKPAADSEKHLICRDYQIVFSSRVFVNYPFGVRMVFARPGMGEPIAAPGSNHRPAFQESEYYGWSRPAAEDPELAVVSGHIEFEAEESAPTIRRGVFSSHRDGRRARPQARRRCRFFLLAESAQAGGRLAEDDGFPYP